MRAALVEPGTEADSQPRPGWAVVGNRVQDLVRSGQLDLPLPGSGRTATRFAALAALAGEDLSLVRLAEGHVDSIAILAEGGRRALPATVYGVWAATSPEAQVTARTGGGGWVLNGRKQFCSGARTVGAALVTAGTEEGVQLFEVALSSPGLRSHPRSWAAAAMADADSLEVDFDGVLVGLEALVGTPGFYTGRPGFWAGAVGVAACWWGGASALVSDLIEYLQRRPGGADAHQLAELGAAAAETGAMWRTIEWAAAAIDGDPNDERGEASARALQVRHVVYRGSLSVLDHLSRAGGPRLMGLDGACARRAADLGIYLGQYHAGRDDAQLGQLVLDGRPWT